MPYVKRGPFMNGGAPALDDTTMNWLDQGIADAHEIVETELPVGPAATGTDTTALQAFLTANPGKRVQLRQGAAYTVNGTLAVPTEGIHVDMRGATITQVATNTPILTTGSTSGTSLVGGTLIGKATDYADTSATYTASAIRATTGAKRVRLIDCEVRGFAGAAVYATGASGVVVRGCTIVGVGAGGGGGSFAFVAGTSKDNAGVIFDGGTVNVWITDNHISYAAQGVLGGTGSADVHVVGNTIRDVGGQHGVYLNHGTNYQISGNTITGVEANGIKVQTQTGGADVLGVSIVGNVMDDCAGGGVVLTCDTGAQRHRDVTVTGNTCRNSGNDGIVLEYVEAGVCVGNIIRGARAGIRVTDVVGVSVKANRIDTTTQDGILAQALDFATSDVVIEANDVRNPASANGAATEFGIRVAAAGGAALTTDVVVKGNTIADTLGNMKYGIYYSTTDQSTYSTVDNTVTGATDHGFRGPATTARAFRGNSFAGTIAAIHTAPTNFVTNPDTTGAALAALETEVNELKAVLRAAGLIRA